MQSNSSFSLETKNRIEPPLQASKWLKIPVLLEEQEMQALIEELEPFWMVLVSQLTLQGQGLIAKEDFLNCYQDYIQSLKKGQLPEDPKIRHYFSSIWTTTSEAVYAVPIDSQQQLIRAVKPVIQLQHHQFDYSMVDGKFRSMVWGPDSIFWGIQFSYPQLYQDPHMQIKQVNENPDFPNTTLFRRLQRWIRYQTIPTAFIVQNQRINIPIRLGKQCLKWINHHPQLAPKGLQVSV